MSTQHAGHIPEWTQGDRLRKAREDAGLDQKELAGRIMAKVLGNGWTAHSLRHRFATRAYAAERDLLTVQQLLGHSSVATTQRYTQVPDDALRRAVDAVA